MASRTASPWLKSRRAVLSITKGRASPTSTNSRVRSPRKKAAATVPCKPVVSWFSATRMSSGRNRISVALSGALAQGRLPALQLNTPFFVVPVRRFIVPMNSATKRVAGCW